MSEQRAEKERQEREAKKAAGASLTSLFMVALIAGSLRNFGMIGELLTGDMVSWKRERGNLTEREVAAMA